MNRYIILLSRRSGAGGNQQVVSTTWNMRKWSYLIWRILYTGLLIWFGAFYLFDPRNELGSEPGYFLLLCGVLPSIVLIPLAWYWPLVARKCALIYGYLILLGALVLVATAEGFLWLLVAIPLLGFPIESIVLSLKRS